MTEPTILIEMHPTQLILHDNDGNNYLVQMDARAISMLKALLSSVIPEASMCKISRLPAEVSVQPSIMLNDLH